MGELTTAAIALGSNLGDRAAHLQHAIARLHEILANLRVSRLRETVPLGMQGPQPLFLNAIAVGEVGGSARELLVVLLGIEQERWRERPRVNAPRTLDLDLVLFGDTTIDEPDLVVPHPRFRERRFVLEPLAEIGPELTDPVTGLSMASLLDRLKD